MEKLYTVGLKQDQELTVAQIINSLMPNSDLKNAFLSDQCKEIEANNRIRKSRYFFKEIRDTKGPFHAKMGSIKDKKWYGPNRSRIY